MATKFIGVLARRRGGTERCGVNSRGSTEEKMSDVREGAIGVVSVVSSDA
jgi:hypothetical protein